MKYVLTIFLKGCINTPFINYYGEILFFVNFHHNLFLLKKIYMEKKRKKKKSWLKRQVYKVQILPWYWKLVFSVLIFFVFGALGMQLFTAPDDVSMILGVVVIIIALWFLLQMWWRNEE